MKEITFKSFLMAQTASDEQALEELLEEQSSTWRLIQVKKNDILSQPGISQQLSFFVEKGLLRYYSMDEKGREHILHFAPEGWFLSDRDSLFGKKTNYFTEALEDSTLISLDKTFFARLKEKNKQIIDMNERLLQAHILQLQKRITQLLSATAEERYLNFIRIYPDIVSRVPQWMVASYLGIAPESLSRVRKDIVSKKK